MGSWQLPQDGVEASVAKLDGVGSGVWVTWCRCPSGGSGGPWGAEGPRSGEWPESSCNEDSLLELRDQEQVLNFVHV